MNPSRLRTAGLVLAGVLLSASAHAQMTLDITARDDRPGPVDVRVEAKDFGGNVLLSTVVSWPLDDNGWTTRPTPALLIPSISSVVRLTFINDQGGATEDTDRNAFIHYLTLNGVVRQGERFDRTGGTDLMFPGCDPFNIDGRDCAACGNQNDWVEYDLPFSRGTTFCNASDGALASCPCLNSGAPNTGCDNAQGTGGVGAAATTIGFTTAVITGTGYPPMAAPTAIVIRANNQEPAPVVFGDGLRCVGLQGFARLAATMAVNGTSTHTVGYNGMFVHYYQIWYRNTPVSYCVTTGASSGAFNLSNGVSF